MDTGDRRSNNRSSHRPNAHRLLIREWRATMTDNNRAIRRRVVSSACPKEDPRLEELEAHLRDN
jgi:hypothetical protein